MRIETALNHRDKAITSTRDIYSMARHGGMSHSELCSENRKIQARLAKCPTWVSSFVSGYERCLMDSLYQSNLVFGGFVDGTFYSVHSKRDDYYGKHGIEPSEYAIDSRVSNRGHYWPDFAIPRPFFISNESES